MLSPSVVATVPWNGCGTSWRLGDRFDEPDRLLDGGRGVVLEAEGEREVEQHLGVGLALDLRIQRRVDGEDEVAFDRGELVDVAVVHEQPVVVAERVAVGLLHGAADRRADVREEQRELMWPASSRRFWSFHAGSVL